MKNTLTLHLKKDKIDSQSHEEIRKRLLLNLFSLKVIDLVMFAIDNHEKEILAVGYENKTIESKDKWNQIKSFRHAISVRD